MTKYYCDICKEEITNVKQNGYECTLPILAQPSFVSSNGQIILQKNMPKELETKDLLLCKTCANIIANFIETSDSEEEKNG